MNKVLVLIALVLMVSGCTRADHATELLTKQGYRNVEITGYSWFACGQDDAFSTGFVATSPSGHNVEGTVCAGFLTKGATIRFK